MKWMTGCLAILLVGCGGKGQGEDDTADDGEDAFQAEALSAPERVIGVPNVDDDLQENGIDWLARNPLDEDMSDLVISPTLQRFVQLSTWRLALQGDTAFLRVWLDEEVLLDEETTEVELPWSDEPLHLRVEFGNSMVQGSLTVEELDKGGATFDEAAISLETGPLLLHHHLQPTERVFMVGPINGTNYSNVSMFNYLSDVLGEVFTAASFWTYGQDVWIQDELQSAYTLAPDGLRNDVILDSIRDRGLDPFPQDALQGPGVGVMTKGSGWANTLDSFGNLEVTPPVSANGRDYPFGRIYYGGKIGSFMPVASELFEFLDAQVMQEPFLVDSTWLCVAHVDEFMTFVPDSTAPRGFRFLYTDVDLAYDILDAMPGDTPLPRYAPNWSHGYGTVAEIRGDLGMRRHNQDLQDMYLEPILQQMTDELGLLEEEIVRMPGMFERVGSCEGYAAAVIPGMLNLLVANLPNGPSHVFLADPFVRASLSNQAEDPFIAEVVERMPEELELHFVDDFEVYHLGLGEVHCGTNDIRTPTDDWWEHADALGGN